MNWKKYLKLIVKSPAKMFFLYTFGRQFSEQASDKKGPDKIF